MAVTGSSAGSPGLVVSASIGAAHWPADGLSKADLVLAADQELYQAKRLRGAHGVTAEDSPQADRPARAEADRAAPFPHGSLLEAAHEMLGAAGLAEIANATLRHAVKIAAVTDAFVAMVDDTAPGSPRKGSTGRPATHTSMRLLAGLGAFETRKLRIRRGTGFWGRVWQEGAPLQDGSGGGVGLVGVPLTDGGQVVGLLGLVAPQPAGLNHERLHQLTRLAALASTAATASARRSQAN
jgi:hypothetical protein